MPGLLLCAVGAAAASVVPLVAPGIPWLTAAVVLGIVAGQVPAVTRRLDSNFAPGIGFASKTLMRAGIVLLGLKLGLGDIADLGLPAILAIVLLVVVAFFATWGLGRMLRLPGPEPVLIAAGFSICGASAIGAMGSATGATLKQQATPVTLVTLCGTLAIAVLPALRAPLGLSTVEFGHWVGAGVHDVGQVVATAQAAGAGALAIAIVVKLTRVVMLAPMVAIASAIVRKRFDAAEQPSEQRSEELGETQRDMPRRPPLVPLFIIGFVAAVLVTTMVDLPTPVLQVADAMQTALLALALFALGTGIHIRSLLRTGWRALIVGLASWALIAVLALAIVRI